MEYTREFEKVLIKFDIQEAKDQTIVRYLEGIDPSMLMWLNCNNTQLLMRFVSYLTTLNNRRKPSYAKENSVGPYSEQTF